MFDIQSDLVVSTVITGVQLVDFTPENGKRFHFIKIHAMQQLKNGEGHTTSIMKCEDPELYKPCVDLIGKQARLTCQMTGNDGNSVIKVVDVQPAKVAQSSVPTAVKAG